jgi:hypothetical protein
MPNPIARRLLHGLQPTQFSYQVTVTATQSTSPKFTFAGGYPPAYIDWGDGTARTAVTSGTEYTHTYAVGGQYIVTLISSSQSRYLTQVDISSDKVSKVFTPFQTFPAITQFWGHTNPAWNQGIEGWQLPTRLDTLYLSIMTTLSCNVATWTIPSTIAQFYIQSSTGLYGNISGWVLPVGTGLKNFQLGFDSKITGDVSSLIIPAGLLTFVLQYTTCTGCPDLSTMVTVTQIVVNNCSLIQATVDLYLSRCVAREASTTYATPVLNVGGTGATKNSAASAAGLADRDTLVAAGWVVTVSV